MKNKLIHFYVILSLSQSISAQDCSNIFKVYLGINGLYADVIKSNTNLEPMLRLDVTMSVATFLESKFSGSISLLNTDPYNDLLQNRDLRYRITFPFYNPNPVATAIIFNGYTICTGYPAQGSHVTTIRLYHTQSFNNFPQSYVPQYETTTRRNALVSLVNLIADPFGIYQSSRTTQRPYYQPQPFVEPTTQIPYDFRPTYSTYQNYEPVYQAQTIPETSSSPVYSIASITHPPLESRNNINPNRDINNILNELNSECGISLKRESQESTGLVFHGKIAQKGQFPWLAAFYYNSLGDNGFLCGGSLLSSKLVITAAHCVQEKKTDLIREAEATFFYFGKYFLYSQTNERDVIYSGVSKLVMHPNYDAYADSYDADIAMAVLLRSIIFTNLIRPICIWTHTTKYDDIINQQGIVAGWGKTESTVSASDRPFFAEIPVVDEATCLRSNDVFSKITSRRTFCAGSNDGKGPCHGDSGGGFLMKYDGKWYLRGVISSALFDQERLTCDTRNYVVFSDVAQFKGWIEGFLKRFG